MGDRMQIIDQIIAGTVVLIIGGIATAIWQALEGNPRAIKFIGSYLLSSSLIFLLLVIIKLVSERIFEKAFYLSYLQLLWWSFVAGVGNCIIQRIAKKMSSFILLNVLWSGILLILIILVMYLL
jgi:hypothetical protein